MAGRCPPFLFVMNKICKNKSCNKLLPIELFRQHKNGSREALCLVCEKDLNKIRCRRRYQEKKNSYKEYKVKNKEKISAYMKEYDRIYKKNKRKINLNYKLRTNISSYINSSLKRKLSNRSSKISKLPYSIEELKKHLESLFEPWMNWSNWGKFDSNNWKDDDPSTWTWQIDHVRPKADFKYKSLEDIQFLECWALANLRPLSSKLNILKGKRKLLNN